MISIKDIHELFGKKVAKIVFMAILLSLACIFIVDITTDNTLSNRIRNYFRPPIAINQLWMYQSPPEPVIDTYTSNVRAVTALSWNMPLRIINKSNQVIFIESVTIQSHCLDKFSDFDDYSGIASSYATSPPDNSNERPFGELLKRYEGCLVDGEPLLAVRYKDEVELQSDSSGGKEVKTYLNFPLKLNPYEEVITRIFFKLNIVAKDKIPLRFEVPNKERERIFERLIPIFFGSFSRQDLNFPLILTFETNQGVFVSIQEVS